MSASSALAVYLAAASLLVCLCAGFVPPQKSLRLAGQLSWHARLGLDALTLLKNRDHRVIFILFWPQCWTSTKVGVT
ncbi:MAG: hypothetical protein ABR924_22045 [Terracidiphilus sp.]